jgi:SAM-dependent methyltransferase
MDLRLTTLAGPLAVCRLAADMSVPTWAVGTLVSITRTDRELSVVCSADAVPDDVSAETGWLALEVAGPLAFTVTGVIEALTRPLADRGIPVFVISTYDTDYLLVRAETLEASRAALRAAGHVVDGQPGEGYVERASLPTESYLSVNRAAWDERAPAHAASPGYAVDRFLADPGFISDVGRFDLPRLGEITGLRGVHLQCHIGTDTVSLARLGARMTGFDFSPPALAEARRLSALVGAHVDFVEGDVYDAAALLGPGVFDLVFTGIGALCWLPDVRRWADVVADLLAPGGRLFIRDGHPMLWTLADRRDNLLVVEDTYFEREEPTIADEPGTYVETDATFDHNTTHSWNHGLGEIVSALVGAGLAITMLVEHDSVPWEALPGQMELVGGGEWRLVDRPWRLPHTYTLQAVKSA